MEILPVTQKVSTQLLIESLREQLGKIEARVASTINMDGMTPLEFRGQCAMVRGSCQHHLTQPEYDAIRLRFGWQRSQAEGVCGVADFIAPLVRIDHPMAMHALLWYRYHRGNRHGLGLRGIERECGISRQRLTASLSIATRAVQALEDRATRRLGDMFLRTGLVPGP